MYSGLKFRGLATLRSMFGRVKVRLSHKRTLKHGHGSIMVWGLFYHLYWCVAQTQHYLTSSQMINTDDPKQTSKQVFE